MERQFPETAVLKISAFCGVRSIPTLCCVSRAWRATVAGNALLADWLYATAVQPITGGPQHKWKQRHTGILNTHSASSFSVNAVRGWAAGLYAATGVSMGRVESAVSALAWGSPPTTLLRMPHTRHTGLGSRLLLTGHVDGTVSLFAAQSHAASGHVAGAVSPAPQLSMGAGATVEGGQGGRGGAGPISLLGASAGLVRMHADIVSGVAGLSPVAVQGAGWGPLTPPSCIHSLSVSLDGRAVVSKWSRQPDDAEDGFNVEHSVRHTWGEAVFVCPLNGVAATHLSSASPCAVVAMNTGELAVLDVATGDVGGRFLAHDRSAYCVAFGPEGGALPPTMLASGGFDTAARIWDIRHAGPAPISLAMPASIPNSSFRAAGWAPGVSRVTARTRKADRDSFNPEHTALDGHAYRVYDVAWSPCGRLLATTGGDAVLRVWDLRAPATPLHQCTLTKRWADCTAWINGSRGVLVAGQDQAVRIFGHSCYSPPDMGGSPPPSICGGDYAHSCTAGALDQSTAGPSEGKQCHGHADSMYSEADVRAWGGLHASSHASLAEAATAARGAAAAQTCTAAAGAHGGAGDPSLHAFPTRGRYCGILDRHQQMVTALLTDGEDTVISSAADGTLTMRVMQPFTAEHLNSIMHSDDMVQTGGVPPPKRSWADAKGGKGGSFKLPARLQQRLHSSAARSEENKRFDSMGAYRVPAGTRMMHRRSALSSQVESHPVCSVLAQGAAQHVSQGGAAAASPDGTSEQDDTVPCQIVQHKLWKPAAVQAMTASLPRASWQQGGAGDVHRASCIRMSNDAAQAATQAISKLPKG